MSVMPRLDEYYQQHRQTWDALYPSERWIFERVGANGSLGRVLDVGCAAGGVGRALAERFVIDHYDGVDVDADVIAAAQARTFPVDTSFTCADIVTLPASSSHDTVIALASADWSDNTQSILSACWGHARPGGTLIVSLRLTRQPTVANITESYQRIATRSGEQRMSYVVLNINDVLGMFADWHPRATRVLGYGYDGAPSASAITPFSTVTFAVFAVTKTESSESSSPPRIELHLPLNLWTRTTP